MAWATGLKRRPRWTFRSRRYEIKSIEEVRLVSLVAGLALLAAWPGYAANVLNRVSVAEGPNQSQVIKIIMKDPVETMPVSFTTSNPHRLVVDFADTTNSIGRVVESLNSATIKNYQVVQAGDRTRVVFNLNVPASHELRKDRNMILVVLQGATQKADASMPASAPAKFAAGKQPTRIRYSRCRFPTWQKQ
jgi:type IV pilus assembly protein PilQ